MLAEQGVHNVAYKIQQHLQEHAEQSRNRKWADEAWQTTCGEHPDLALDEDHAEGFRCGFLEYVWRGGNGEPPPLPPLKYRAVRYQTPAGYRAIESWFAGYRHGAEVAHQGGYRDLVTGPSSLRKPSPHAPEPPPGLPVEGPVWDHAASGKENGADSTGPPAAPGIAPRLPPPQPAEADGATSSGIPADSATRWDWLDPRSTPWHAQAATETGSAAGQGVRLLGASTPLRPCPASPLRPQSAPPVRMLPAPE
jgi:hypothetical protein